MGQGTIGFFFRMGFPVDPLLPFDLHPSRESRVFLGHHAGILYPYGSGSGIPVLGPSKDLAKELVPVAGISPGVSERLLVFSVYLSPVVPGDQAT